MKLKNLQVGDICFPTNEAKIPDYSLKDIKMSKKTHFKIEKIDSKNSCYHVQSIRVIPSNRIISERYEIERILTSGWYSIKKRDWKISTIKIK